MSTAVAATVRPRPVRSAVSADALGVLGQALRVLWRHWPLLLVLDLGGRLARLLLIDVAAQASAISAVVGAMVLVLAPLAMMTSLILMLRVLRSSLPYIGPLARAPEELTAEATDAASSRRWRAWRRLRELDEVGSVLVPFLTVYATSGYLREDMVAYANAVLQDEVFASPDIFSGGTVDTAARLPFSPTLATLTLVAVAFALRRIFAARRATTRVRGLGVLAAYVEVLWLTGATAALGTARNDIDSWVRSRRVVVWAQHTWATFVDQVGPVVAIVHAVVSWLATLIGTATAVIVVPVAWLAIGAVVYGEAIREVQGPRPRLLVYVSARWQRLHRQVQRAGTELTADVRGRFGALWSGLRLLRRAGLVPMALFCLAFVATQAGTDWIWELERAIIGPRALDPFWFSITPPLTLLNDSLATLPLICLVAAAVDRVIKMQAGVAKPVAAAVATSDEREAVDPAGLDERQPDGTGSTA